MNVKLVFNVRFRETNMDDSMRSAPSLFLFLEVSSKDLAKSRYSPKSMSVAKKAECDSYVSGQVRHVWMLDPISAFFISFHP